MSVWASVCVCACLCGLVCVLVVHALMRPHRSACACAVDRDVQPNVEVRVGARNVTLS